MVNIDSLRERPLSFSSIKEFAKSPRHYIDYINRPKTAPTDAMKLGSLVHCLMLRPELFNDQYAICPDINKRTNAGKEEFAKFSELNSSKTIVENSDYEHARKLVDTAMTNDSIYNAVKSCYDYEREWSMDIDDLPYRGFYDGISTDYVLEVKTINDGNPKNVISDFFKRKYHLQASLYSMSQFGLPVLYVIIETSHPNLSYIAIADDDYIGQGSKEIGRLNERFKYCMQENSFDKGYEFHISGDVKIGLPWSVEK